MSTALISALLGGVIVAIITQLFQFVHAHLAHKRSLETTRLTHDHERAMSQIADARTLRDKRAERLRSIYSDLLRFTDRSIKGLQLAGPISIEGWSREQIADHIRTTTQAVEEWQFLNQSMKESAYLLAMEEETAPVRAIISTITRDCEEYATSLHLPGSAVQAVERANALRPQLQGRYNELVESIRTHLASLESPI